MRQQPWQGTAYDAERVRAEVQVDGAALTSAAFGAQAVLRGVVDGTRVRLTFAAP